MCGVTVPLHSAEHMYIVTGKIEGVHPDLPVMRDPDGYIYFKEEVGGLRHGRLRAGRQAVGHGRHPGRFRVPAAARRLGPVRDPDGERAASACRRWRRAEVKNFLNGPESFTPDNNFILGEAPELRSVFVGAGFNSMGIACAGGAGRALAEWIVEGEPTMDLWPVDIRRFARLQQQPGLAARPRQGNARPALRHALAEPRARHARGRSAARRSTTGSPPRARCSARRWAGSGRTCSPAPATSGAIDYSFGRQNWFDAVAAEHRACREAVALFDMTSFAKFLLQGPRRGSGAAACSAPTTSPCRSAARSTRRCSTSAAASRATSPSPASAPTPS